MLNISETILNKILQDNRGRKLTIDEVIELSKMDEYSQGHPFYSKNGITESFVTNTIIDYYNILNELHNDFLFGLLQEVKFEDGKITNIVVSEKKHISKRSILFSFII